MVGRKASSPLRSSCWRTTCSWRERVQIANQARLSDRLGSNLLLVNLLELVVLPLDQRLGPKAGDELAHLGLGPGAGDLVGDQIADAVERLQDRRLDGFELENLITARRAD